MIKHYFCVLFLVHILCDFYLQSQKMSENKQQNFLWVIIHSAVYAVVGVILLKAVIPGLPGKYLFYFAISHALIDGIKYAVCNCGSMKTISFFKKSINVFIADQLLHIMVIFTITYFIRDIKPEILYSAEIKNIFDVFNVSETVILRWGIKLTLIHKPANIFISNMLSEYRPDSKNCREPSDKNAGRFIGTLERIIMVILISINQYSAAGLVLTAKSIARYDKISKEQEFAEYYLLGTLLSTICAIGVSVIF